MNKKVDYLSVVENYWDLNASDYDRQHPEHRILALHPSWGLGHLPESHLKIFESKLKKPCTILDLGCGQGHDAVGYAELGHTVIALDISEQQLARAIKHDRVTYIRRAGEKTLLPDESIDIVYSDHGAFDHAPPSQLLLECNRILKNNGLLGICTYTPLAHTCFSSEENRLSETLNRPYPNKDYTFDGRIVTSALSHGNWIEEFNQHGFVVEKLKEITVSDHAYRFYSDILSEGWPNSWPIDLIWLVRKTQ